MTEMLSLPDLSHASWNRSTFPPPTQGITEVAARERFGNCLSTFAAKPDLGPGRQQGSRLYVYRSGVIVTAPGDYVGAYAWETMRVLQYPPSVESGAGYRSCTLIDPHGNAVALGPGGLYLTRAARREYGITSAVQGSRILYPSEWGPYIQKAVAAAQLNPTLLRMARGETIDFGPLKADRIGLHDSEKSVAWQDIADFDLSHRTLTFNSPCMRPVLAATDTYKIVNIHLFLTLCRTLTP
ncbi:hypothetical protein ACFV9W_37725 [Streptomyces sp. NPDC059897]|uniref:hypothetical protein n=1 Tax=Streptomyces sp. NPDC059897 TaxID=3346994 RepID=UPI00365D864A